MATLVEERSIVLGLARQSHIPGVIGIIVLEPKKQMGEKKKIRGGMEML